MFDVSLAGAALAGLLSFLSPCILPIVPFYLGYMAGAGLNAIETDGVVAREIRLKAILSAIAFSAGVITVRSCMRAGWSKTVWRWIQTSVRLFITLRSN